jgi:hypothetical protein
MNSRLAARCLLSLIAIAGASLLASADGPKDNIASNVRPIPPLPTTPLSASDRAALEEGVAKLGHEIESLRTEIKDARLASLLPDVEIYFNAVRYPLIYNEQIDPKAGQKALADGMDRARQLRSGEAPWLITGGPRGYLSKIDGSIQPYMLGVPVGYTPPAPSGKLRLYRIDFNEHGRGEDLTELKFISGKVGAAPGKFVVNLYGRYCCANKFAGEIDLFECLHSLRQQYPIDENRILNIGFSMGGAACWQFATHYPDRWAAASPGAGFAETREFLHNFQNETVKPAWYEQKLWHWYDCTDYAVNLFNCPTIAYSGEFDSQKQSADIMAKYMAEEGLKLDRIIGPNVKHAYEKNAKIQLDARLDEILAKGRNPVPTKIRFTTWTLRYNRCFWLTINGMGRHWERARVDAEVAENQIIAKTQNVTALTLSFPAGAAPRKPGANLIVMLDDVRVITPPGESDKPWSASFVKTGNVWQAAVPDGAGLRKKHGLQGPIDDAFMDSFLIVQPTGKAAHPAVDAWTNAECHHAIDHWRKQFRGEARVKSDTEVTEADFANHNLVLFGDASSNKVIAQLAVKLPIQWTAQQIAVGAKNFPADHHALIAIYPNPANPKRYIVLNSGFTFREYDYLNNARQIAKLPDYAVIDVNVPADARTPGGVVDAGFFGEHWELLPDEGRDAESK